MSIQSRVPKAMPKKTRQEQEEFDAEYEWVEVEPGRQILRKRQNTLDNSQVTNHKSPQVRIQPNEQYFKHHKMKRPIRLTGTPQERKATLKQEWAKYEGERPCDVLNLD